VHAANMPIAMAKLNASAAAPHQSKFHAEAAAATFLHEDEVHPKPACVGPHTAAHIVKRLADQIADTRIEMT
jgi:hypothetical protein